MATDVFFGVDIVENKTEADVLNEIQELERQQKEINERLKNFRGNATRTTRPLPHGFSTGGRGFLGGNMGTGGRGRGKHPRANIQNSEELQVEESPAKKRLLSSVVKVNDEMKMNYDCDDFNREEMETESNTNTQKIEQDETPVPRVLPITNDTGLIKRNRRMFGALLLGTLEKFKEEDKKLQDSDAFLRRSNTMKRAEQKAMEENEKLRKEAKQRYQDRQKRDLILKARLEAKTEEKQLQILFMKWNAHQLQLSSFLRTKSQPCVYFAPAKPCDVVNKILEEQKKELEDWKVSRLSEMKTYHDSIKEEYIQAAIDEKPLMKKNSISSTATLVVRGEEEHGQKEHMGNVQDEEHDGFEELEELRGEEDRHENLEKETEDNKDEENVGEQNMQDDENND